MVCTFGTGSLDHHCAGLLPGNQGPAKRALVACAADDRICPGDVAKDIRDRVTSGHTHPVVYKDDTEERKSPFIDIDEGVQP